MKILIFLILILSNIFAEFKDIEATPKFLEKDITIIDIRTKPEWIQTGIVKGSIPITFFDEKGRYDARAFLQKIDRYVSKDKEFAIICRTGNRTTTVSRFLDKMGYKVINLKGGVVSLGKKGYKLTSYRP
jgi:rhodanese-related sulfurtransferase